MKDLYLNSISSFLLLLLSISLFSQESRELVVDNPDVVVDLRTKRGVELVKTKWKYSDAFIVDDKFGAPGPSKDDPLALYPTCLLYTSDAADD